MFQLAMGNRQNQCGGVKTWFCGRVCVCSVVSDSLPSHGLQPGLQQAPLAVEFSRQEYWSGLPLPTLGHLLDPGIKPTCFLRLLHWGLDSLLLGHLGIPGEGYLCQFNQLKLVACLFLKYVKGTFYRIMTEIGKTSRAVPKELLPLSVA